MTHQHYIKILAGILIFISLSLKAEPSSAPLAPAYSPLQFSAPTPESYALPILGKAIDGHVIDSNGQPTTLHNLMSNDKITVLSFIYATCSDVNGCPLATMVLHNMAKRLQQQSDIANKVRLLTLSFNPKHDTPAVMQQYGKNFKTEVEWHFLTTDSERTLQPILQGYQQHIEKIHDVNGKDTGTFSHVLRVYLIDQQRQLRNSYSVSFLHADTLINDIKSLLQPIKQTVTSNTHQAINHTTQNHMVSTDKQRQNKAIDLLKTIRQPPLGLPKVPIPKYNPITRAKINLGRKLFYDRRLSLNNTFSCAMCHIAEQGFTSNEMATAVGVEGRTVRRNSPSLYNSAYFSLLFHDGRENQLEQQAWLPLLAHNEMANPSISTVIDKINQSDNYPKLFQQAFHKPASMETVGMALASYERTLNSANSAFDRWYYGHDKSALTLNAQRGFQLFTGKAGCVSCHSINADYALFTDNGLHNTGIGYQQAMVSNETQQSVQLAPGVFVNVDNKVIDTVSESKANDLGRYEISQKPEDRWKYKTPSLRNVALTAPYMHNGSFASLHDVLEFYNQGGISNENLDPLIKPLHLTPQELSDLEHFLLALTGSNVTELVSDGLAAPVGDAH